MELDPRQTIIVAVLVLFLGKYLTRNIAFLREYNIPEPVSGGLIASILFGVLYAAFDFELSFALQLRDSLLITFFTTIGLSSRFATLIEGGKPLLILLVVAVTYLFIQNFTGLAAASLTGQPAEIGIIGGSVSLSGGHGTAIALAPRFVEVYGVGNAMEIGVACATFGLVLGGLIGGPIAKFLITHPGWGLGLPTFVTCLFAGILVTNLGPLVFTRLHWPERSHSLSLIADLSLGLFLAMSLMSLQLWTLAGVGGSILLLLVAQVIVITIFVVFVVFRLMGKDYDAAVMSAGYAGLALERRQPRLQT